MIKTWYIIWTNTHMLNCIQVHHQCDNLNLILCWSPCIILKIITGSRQHDSTCLDNKIITRECFLIGTLLIITVIKTLFQLKFLCIYWHDSEKLLSSIIKVNEASGKYKTAIGFCMVFNTLNLVLQYSDVVVARWSLITLNHRN